MLKAQISTFLKAQVSSSLKRKGSFKKAQMSYQKAQMSFAGFSELTLIKILTTISRWNKICYMYYTWCCQLLKLEKKTKNVYKLFCFVFVFAVISTKWYCNLHNSEYMYLLTGLRTIAFERNPFLCCFDNVTTIIIGIFMFCICFAYIMYMLFI